MKTSFAKEKRSGQPPGRSAHHDADEIKRSAAELREQAQAGTAAIAEMIRNVKFGAESPQLLQKGEWRTSISVWKGRESFDALISFMSLSGVKPAERLVLRLQGTDTKATWTGVTDRSALCWFRDLPVDEQFTAELVTDARDELGALLSGTMKEIREIGLADFRGQHWKVSGRKSSVEGEIHLEIHRITPEANAGIIELWSPSNRSRFQGYHVTGASIFSQIPSEGLQPLFLEPRLAQVKQASEPNSIVPFPERMNVVKLAALKPSTGPMYRRGVSVFSANRQLEARLSPNEHSIAVYVWNADGSLPGREVMVEFGGKVLRRTLRYSERHGAVMTEMEFGASPTTEIETLSLSFKLVDQAIQD